MIIGDNRKLLFPFEVILKQNPKKIAIILILSATLIFLDIN